MDAIRVVRRDKVLEPQAVEDAILALFGGTISHPDTRAMFAGVDVSPASIERMF